MVLHQLLTAQIKKHLGNGALIPEAFTTFIESVSASYDLFNNEVASLELSLKNSLMDLNELRENLQNETAGLKKAHQELSTIFNHVNEGFFVKDVVADRYIQLSVGCEKIYGHSISDFFGNSKLWSEVIHPEDLVLIESENELLMKGIQTKSSYRIIHPDTTIKWIEVKAIPVLSEGRLIKVEGVVNDITERKNAEQLLIDSELKYRSFFENNLDGILIGEPRGGILEVNPAACEIFRQTEKEICQYARQELFAFVPGIEAAMEERHRTGKYMGELDIFRRDGTHFVAEITSSIFTDFRGYERTCTIMRDITYRRETEALMVMNERELDLIYNTVTDGIFMLDIETGDRYKYISVNKSFLQSTGLEKEEVVGKYLDEVLPALSIRVFIENCAQAIMSKKTISWEDETEYGTSTKTGIVSISPVLDDKGFCIRIIGSVHDITERKKVEEEIRKSDKNFESLVNTIDGIVWEANAETFQFNFVSRQAEVLLGYPVTAWTGEPDFWEKHLHPDDRDMAIAYCLKCTGEKKSHEFEYRMMAADGSVVWLQDFVSVVINEDLSCYLRGIMLDISERKQSEQTIRDSEEKYHSLLEHASDAIFINTTRGKLLDVNQSACDMLGYSKEQLSSMQISDLVLPGDQGFNPFERDSVPHPETGSSEINMVHRNGSLVPVDISSKVLSDGRIIAIARNITERRIAEKNNRESIERFQRLSQATHDSIWDWNLLTEEIWWNESFFKLLGYNKDLPIPGLYEWTVKIHPDDREKVVNRLRHVRKSELNFWEDEFRYEMSENVFGTVLDRAYVLRDDAGKPIRVIGAIMDITERKKTEQRILQSERRFRQIVETAQEGIWMIDEFNNTTFINKKMCDIIEYQPEEIIGKAIHSFMDAAANIDAAAQIERRKQGISETHDANFISKSGKVVITNLSTNAVFDDAGIYKGALAMITDITKRKQSEELLKRSEANLDLKNRELKRKNKELEEFAYIASHDLQEPLRTTTSFVQLLKEQYAGKLDERADKYLHFIVDSSDRMRVLIDDMLDYSRIGSKPGSERVDCNKVMKDVLADLYKIISDCGAMISVGDLPVINGYPTEIKQLFQNLLVNAMKFRKEATVPRIDISVERSADCWNFAIADNGIGIDKAYNEKIFIIFQRLHTRSVYQGSGIGLSHCKKIVELHHGKIWVDSEPGIGSTFYFTISENGNLQST